jgi:hypothetical protein
MIAGPLIFFFYVTIGLCMEFASTTRNLKLGFLRVAHPLTFLCLRSAMSHLTNGSPNACGGWGPGTPLDTRTQFNCSIVVGVVANLGASRLGLGQRYGARRVSVFLYPGYLCVPKTLIAPDARAGVTTIVSRMTVGFSAFEVSYANRTTADTVGRQIRIEALDGPFVF